MLDDDKWQKREEKIMYLSTVFLTEIDNGAENAIRKCNEEFLKRFGTLQDYLSLSFVKDCFGKVLQINCQCDEMMALWDVYKDFKDEIFLDLPVIEAMNTTCAIRNEVNETFRTQRLTI